MLVGRVKEQIQEEVDRLCRSVLNGVKPGQLGEKMAVEAGGSIPGRIDYGGANTKVCFVSSEENGLAEAENICWGVMGDKVGKGLLLCGLS